GHSIRDDETKFGYSVTGLVDPERVLKNGGAQPGDRLLLTKGLGTGVISTAIKKGVAKQEGIDAAVKSMTTLNKTTAEVIMSHVAGRTPSIDQKVPRPSRDIPHDARRATQDAVSNNQQPKPNTPVHALTDITGFGLIGHLREMLLASENVSAKLHASRMP